MNAVRLLTEHDEGGGALLTARGVGGVLAGVAAGVAHAEAGDANGRVVQRSQDEGHAVLAGRVGEALAVGGVEHGDVVPLALHRLPDPRHLGATES